MALFKTYLPVQLPLWQRSWHRDLIRAHPNAFLLSQAMIMTYPSSAPMLGRLLSDGIRALGLGCEYHTKSFRFPYTSVYSHNIWLRDHCRCPKCFHPVTKQRLLDTFEVRRFISLIIPLIDALRYQLTLPPYISRPRLRDSKLPVRSLHFHLFVSSLTYTTRAFARPTCVPVSLVLASTTFIRSFARWQRRLARVRMSAIYYV